MHDHSWSLFILPVHSWFIKLKNETTGPHLFLNGKLFAAKRCIHGNISTYHVADIPGHRPKSDLAEVSIMRQCWGSHATWHQTAQRHHKTGSTSRSKLGNQQRMKRRLRCAVSFYMQQMLHSYPWFIFKHNKWPLPMHSPWNFFESDCLSQMPHARNIIYIPAFLINLNIPYVEHLGIGPLTPSGNWKTLLSKQQSFKLSCGYGSKNLMPKNGWFYTRHDSKLVVPKCQPYLGCHPPEHNTAKPRIEYLELSSILARPQRNMLLQFTNNKYQ